jgi:hypothetical protein
MATREYVGGDTSLGFRGFVSRRATCQCVPVNDVINDNFSVTLGSVAAP